MDELRSAGIDISEMGFTQIHVGRNVVVECRQRFQIA